MLPSFFLARGSEAQKLTRRRAPALFYPFTALHALKMPICHALTRAGHPCRGHGVHVTNSLGAEGYLCHRHTEYFQEAQPDQHVASIVYSFMDDTERRWILQMLRSPLYERDNARTMTYLKPMMDGSRNDAQRGVYIYDLYVQAGVLAPLASLPFWKRCVQYGLRVLGYSCTVNPADGSVTFPGHFGGLVTTMFRHLFRGLPTNVVLHYFLEFMRQRIETSPPVVYSPAVHARACAEIWRRILDEVLPLTAHRCLLGYSVEALLGRIDEKHAEYAASTWRHPGVREHTEAALKAIQCAEKKAARARQEPLREELMMAAWHPKRVWRWVEAGIDPEDM